MAEGSSVAGASAADLQRLSVAVPRPEADGLAAALAEVAPAGWAEEDDPSQAVAVLWAPAADADAGPRLARALAERGVHARVAAAPQDDGWVDGLRRHHVPVDIAGVLRVRPPWSAPVPGRLDVVIDPGMAFGTGQHATTTGCLTLLAGLAPGSLLDVGSGSGILSIAARRLGFDPVTALDVDPLAVAATVANARANGVGLRVRLRTGAEPPPAADVVVANITRTHVVALAAELTTPPRTAVLSGFRPAEAAAVLAAWEARGLRPTDRRDADDWTALRLDRP